ncbi:MAG TPA: tetratricopeptide repeat protein [Urbifossiella sp.]|jgi:tetratricopeptide (TPR) repeat protein|nr:tetratricopeptide repeat protein [Urbifossiella sp.]
MTGFSEYLEGCVERANASGDFQEFTHEVFAARRKCEFTAKEWQDAVPHLVETVFRPLIDGIEDAERQNYLMIILGIYLSDDSLDTVASEWLQRAADVAEGLDNPLTRCNAFLQYGAMLSTTGRDAEAADYLKRAAGAAEGLDNPLARCNAFLQYGALLLTTGRHPEAADYLKRAADAAEGLDNPLARCNAFSGYGRYWHAVSQPITALDWYQKAQRELRLCLIPNAYPEAIRTILQTNSWIYEISLVSSQNAYLARSDPAVLLPGATAVDGNKAIWVSIGLDRTASHPHRPSTWESSHDFGAPLFAGEIPGQGWPSGHSL